MRISEPAEYVILGLLMDRPMHGYDIFQYFEKGIIQEIVHVEMSQMYAFLKKQERMDYIQAQVEMQGNRPPRRMHQITESGRTVFQAWLTQPVEKPRDIRLLFLLKLYFIQRIFPAKTTHLIEQQIQACQRFLSRLETKLPEQIESSDEDFFAHVVLRSRIQQTHSLLDWLHELQEELAGKTHS